MAGKTVDPVGIAEIKVGILPTIPHMTTGTTWPVAIYRDAEIVNDVALAAFDFLAVDGLFGRPGPVTGFHNMVSSIFMTFQTFFSNFRAVVERTFDAGMITVCQYRACQGYGKNCETEQLRNFFQTSKHD